MNTAYSFDRLDSIHSVLETIESYKKQRISNNVIDYLNIFLINEVKGNALDFYYENKNVNQMKNQILSFLPNKVPVFKFISSKRSLWLMSMYVFYKFPVTAIKFYSKIQKL